MKCPNCAAGAEDGALDCPACGLVFAKWHALQAKRAAAPPPEPEAAAAPGPNLWAGRAIAVGVVVLWTAGWALYYRHRLKSVKLPPGRPTGEFVELRDPATGELRRMPVRHLEKLR